MRIFFIRADQMQADGANYAAETPINLQNKTSVKINRNYNSQQTSDYSSNPTSNPILSGQNSNQLNFNMSSGDRQSENQFQQQHTVTDIFAQQRACNDQRNARIQQQAYRDFDNFAMQDDSQISSGGSQHRQVYNNSIVHSGTTYYNQPAPTSNNGFDSNSMNSGPYPTTVSINTSVPTSQTVPGFHSAGEVWPMHQDSIFDQQRFQQQIPFQFNIPSNASGFPSGGQRTSNVRNREQTGYSPNQNHFHDPYQQSHPLHHNVIRTNVQLSSAYRMTMDASMDSMDLEPDITYFPIRQQRTAEVTISRNRVAQPDFNSFPQTKKSKKSTKKENNIDHPDFNALKTAKSEDAKVVKRGYLQKRGQFVTTWRKRYFALYSNGQMIGWNQDPRKANYPDVDEVYNDFDLLAQSKSPLNNFHIRQCQVRQTQGDGQGDGGRNSQNSNRFTVMLYHNGGSENKRDKSGEQACRNFNAADFVTKTEWIEAIERVRNSVAGVHRGIKIFKKKL